MPTSDVSDISGTVAVGYESVREAFARNFSEHGDQGAAVAVYVDGQNVVDLWGGVADITSGRRWTDDTLVLVYSVTKGATAALCALLAERGELDLDAPVATYWPEFAANGKERITTRQILSHVAGLPVVDAELTLEQHIGGREVVEALARQKPVWAPGTAHGYHGLTFGPLIGEIVLRATGRSVGDQLATEIAGPLGLDFFIGLPEQHEARVAPLIDPPPPDPAALDAIEDPAVKTFILGLVEKMSDPTSLLFRMGTSNGVLPTPSAEHWNRRALHAMEQPAANGITNARSLARLYASCVSEVDGVRLLSDDALREATRERASGQDQVIGFNSRVASGFTLRSASLDLFSDSSFGHLGAGGALGFGDIAHKIGFGYVTNQIGGSPAGDPRTAGLIDALHGCVGG